MSKQFQHYGKRYGYEDRRLATAIFEVFQEIEGDRSGIDYEQLATAIADKLNPGGFQKTDNFIATTAGVLPSGYKGVVFSNIGSEEGTVNGKPLPQGATTAWEATGNKLLAATPYDPRGGAFFVATLKDVEDDSALLLDTTPTQD
jgi:hypothetical protein